MAIFTGIEDIRGQKLNPTKLKQQGNMMIPNYDYQNATYGLITKRVASLCEESKLKGAALEGFKYQMTTYKDVLDGLCYANELDKYDISVVNADLDAKLGDECLNGTEILDELQKAKDALDSDRGQKEHWERELEHCDDIWDAWYAIQCRWNIHKYKGRMEDDQEDIDYWTERANLFVELNNELKDYFDNGFNFREAVKEGIKALRQSYDLDTNSYKVGDYSWKLGMNGMIESSVVDKDGNVNLDLVGQILSKDADAISDTEYAVVGYAYANMSTEQMNDFYMMFEVPKDVDQGKECRLYNQGKLDNITLSNGMVFTVDSKKINNMCKQMDNYQTVLLATMKYGEEPNVSEASELRDVYLQRITMAKTVDSINVFYGWDGESCFDFKENDHGGIQLNYKDLNEATQGTMATYDNHNVTVSATLDSSALELAAISKAKQSELHKLTNYSEAGIVAEDIAGEVVGQAFGQAGKVGSFATFGLGILKDLEENEQNQATIEANFGLVEAGYIADEYGCYGNTVSYDDYTVDISIYEGEKTAAVAEAIGKATGTNSNVEDIVTNPVGTFNELSDYLMFEVGESGDIEPDPERAEILNEAIESVN